MDDFRSRFRGLVVVVMVVVDFGCGFCGFGGCGGGDGG